MFNTYSLLYYTNICYTWPIPSVVFSLNSSKLTHKSSIHQFQLQTLIYNLFAFDNASVCCQEFYTFFQSKHPYISAQKWVHAYVMCGEQKHGSFSLAPRECFISPWMLTTEVNKSSLEQQTTECFCQRPMSSCRVEETQCQQAACSTECCAEKVDCQPKQRHIFLRREGLW